MKVTSSPFVSIASHPLQPSHPCSAEQAQPVISQAARSAGNKSGFWAASQRLAQRRLAANEHRDNVMEAMQSKLAHVLYSSKVSPGDSQRRRLKRLPQYPRQIHQYRTLAEADLERSQLTAQDQFEVHDLDEQLLTELRQQLQRYPVMRASLVKKTLRFFPEQPLYVLLVAPQENDTEQDNELESCQIESTLGTQIAQELCFSRELLVCLTCNTEPHLVGRIEEKSQGNLLEV